MDCGFEVTFAEGPRADISARRTWDNINIRRRLCGGIPWTLWNALRRPRSLTASIRYSVAMLSGVWPAAIAILSAWSTRPRSISRPARPDYDNLTNARAGNDDRTFAPTRLRARSMAQAILFALALEW